MMGVNGLLTKTTSSLLRAFALVTFVSVLFLQGGPRAFVFQRPSEKSPFNFPEKIALIYSADPTDPWNSIFHLLFTRTIRSKLSNDFDRNGPFIPAETMGLRDLKVSTQSVERVEIADRAIDPLYPTFFTDAGVSPILSEPHFSKLTQALSSVLSEQNPRSITARALMQMDLWAAYDILYHRQSSVNYKNQQVLLTLFAQCVHKLALTQDELSQIPGNYSKAGVEQLPDLFNPNSGWLEIQLMPDRLHDFNVHLRRVARVFIKPIHEPTDKRTFVESLKFNKHTEQIDASALVIQSLLIDRDGRIRAVPIITDVQLRVFSKTLNQQAQVKEFELSREKLLADPRSTGFISEADNSQSYLAVAGNDYGFATPLYKADAPVLVLLRTRCSECHGKSQTHSMTLSVHDFIETPPVRILDPLGTDRLDYVSSEKEKRSDFKSLIARW